jgi:superfamily II DNA or RNA helicase
MEAVIGPIRHEITSEELRAGGVLVVPQIVWIPTDFYYPNDDWVELINTLTKDERRNALILGVVERLIDAGRRVIALSERVSHAEMLAEAINTSRPGRSVVITGSMSGKKREATLERVRSGEASALFSTKLADEGLDIPALDALVLTTPSRNGGRTTQRAGRILRSLDGKRQPLIIDVVDPRVGLLWSQARTRYFESYKNLAPGCRLPDWLERSKRRVA